MLQKNSKIGKMVKKWRKSPYFGEKIAKNGGFLRFFGQNWGVFVVCALSCPAELWDFVGSDWGGIIGIITQVLRNAKLDTALRRYDDKAVGDADT